MTSEPPDPTEQHGSAALQRATINVIINYLRWFAAEGAFLDQVGGFNPESTLKWFCQTLPHEPLLPVLRDRYTKLTEQDAAIFAFPNERVLVEKVLIPLHQAKVAFIMGHELSCIALSGMVAEMLATLRFQVSRFGTGPTALTESQQKRFFGDEFERLPHNRRVGTLELLHLIDESTASVFTKLSKIRNSYLHRWSHPHEEMARDAIEAYRSVVQLTIRILGLGLQQGGIMMHAEVVRYVMAQEGRTPMASSAQTNDT